MPKEVTKFVLDDHSDEVLEELEKKVMLALAKIGTTVEGNAKKLCPVDTGRLKNSITWATEDHYGSYDYKDNNGKSWSDKSGKPVEKQSVYIGTNVVYAARQEFGETYKHEEGHAHYLKNGATQDKDKLKKEVKKILEM